MFHQFSSIKGFFCLTVNQPRRPLLFSLTALFIVLFCSSSFAQKTYETARTAAPPVIDGKLDDPAWNPSQWADDFLQSDPDEFAAPSEKTAFAIVYDDEALYVAVKCFDSQPVLVQKKIRRRDSWTAADWVYVGFDSRNDKQTAFVFGLNAGGSMRDIYYYNDDDSDDSWDSVWEGKTSTDQEGWNAEFKIPYTSLRFPPAPEYTWGLNLVREIPRKNEEIWWVVKPRKDTGFVSRFGSINGIRNIPQPFNLEVLPYGNAKYLNTAEEQDLESGFGIDLKYSLNSGFIVDATVNPDFGQIEADPAELNLGVFETYYSEKRPFFLEGASFFETPFQLFYSRRIGAYPGYYSFNNNEEIVSQPDNSTILSAVKFTGKTSNGVSLGFIEAVTDREYATVEDTSGSRRNALLESYNNFFVGRVMKDLGKGNSTIGFMSTARNRENGMSAYVDAIDWNLKFLDNNYSLVGQTLLSDRGETPDDRETGYGFNMELEKQGGKHHCFEIDFTAKSPDFCINDMGFNNRGDQLYLYTGYWYKTLEPIGIFRRTWIGFDHWHGWNYDGVVLDNGIEYWINLQYLNYFWTNWGMHYNFRHYNDLETRGGPLIRPPENWGGWMWCSTDQSKKTYTDINFWAGKNLSQSWWWGLYYEIATTPIDRLETSVTFSYEKMFDENQWVENVEDANDSTHYVFGRLLHKTVNFTVRASYSFSRDMTLQIYTQPYNSVGKYREYIELAQPGTYNFQPFNYTDDADFNYKNLNFNAIFRWEYAPGSVFYLVWTRNMEDESNPGGFNFNHNWHYLSQSEPNDIYMIKINKWFNF